MLYILLAIIAACLLFGGAAVRSSLASVVGFFISVILVVKAYDVIKDNFIPIASVTAVGVVLIVVAYMLQSRNPSTPTDAEISVASQISAPPPIAAPTKEQKILIMRRELAKMRADGKADSPRANAIRSELSRCEQEEDAPHA